MSRESRYKLDDELRANPDTCGRENFWIRKEKVTDSKISDTCGRVHKKNPTFPTRDGEQERSWERW